jgi:hypothetical protein
MTIIALKHHSEFAYKTIFSEYVHILNIDNSRKNKHFPTLLSLQQIKSNLQLAHAIKSSLLQHTYTPPAESTDVLCTGLEVYGCPEHRWNRKLRLIW